MSNPLLIKTFVAGAAIAPYRVVKFSAADTVIQGAAAADVLIGVNDDVAPATGERTDTILAGMCFVEAGAAFAIGARLTSDSVGRAVTAAPATGVNNGVIGLAVDAAAAAGDIVRMIISQATLQG